MTDERRFTAEDARAAGERIGIDWSTSRFAVMEAEAEAYWKVREP